MISTFRLRARLSGLFDAGGDDAGPLIGFVRERLADGPSLRLLSFGRVSDVFALRRHFPGAFIKGIDLDAAEIALCLARRAQANDVNMSFAVAGSAVTEAARSYDAIFSLAEGPAARFDDFARATADFARCLKPGGFLALSHGTFRFLDTAAARHFVSIAPSLYRKGA
jgi:SAM-dependent methyltransferase